MKHLQNKKILIPVVIVLILIVAAGGVFAYEKGKQVGANTNASAYRARYGRGGNFNFANLSIVSGTINSVQSDTAVVNTDNNQGQKIVLLSSSTRVMKSVTDSQSDVIAKGKYVSIRTTNNNNQLDATSVTLVSVQMRRPQRNGGFRMQFGTRPRPTQTTASPVITGKITAISGNTISVQGINNVTHIVYLQSNTTYAKQEKGSISDVVQNAQVTITGTTNSSGTVQARSVSIIG